MSQLWWNSEVVHKSSPGDKRGVKNHSGIFPTGIDVIPTPVYAFIPTSCYSHSQIGVFLSIPTELPLPTRTTWMDNIKTWTGLSVEQSVRMTEDRDKWRKYVHGVDNPRIEDS